MFRKLKCTVVDDDPMSIEIIKDYTLASPIAEINNSFNCSKQFIKAFPTLDTELLLLDVSMPEIDGFQVIKLLKDVPFIYITGFEKKLKEATKLAPIDLIYKPFDKERLYKGLEKAYKVIHGNIQNRLEYELFEVDGITGQAKIKLSDIVFVSVDEAERRHKNIVLKNGEKHKLLYCNFDRLLLHAPNLVQVNKSHLISMEILSSYEVDLLTLDIPGENGKPRQITLSRTYKQNLINRIYS